MGRGLLPLTKFQGGIITLSDVIEGVLSHHALDNLGHLRHFGDIVTLIDKGDRCDVLRSASY